ncbi:MAG: T9SS type A sorting domain-containing protein [Dysgonamonadaceae bacterium]|nr:T9SS type A sorting domain-containing protein [Dysgonamonadaceae bacterium]
MKNKKQILLLFLTAIPAMLPAQFVLKRALNAPRPGDEIIKRQVEYKDPGRSGENVIWDFGKLPSVNDEYSLVYSSPSLTGNSAYIMGMDTIPASEAESDELITGTEHYTMYYYRLSEGGLHVLGHENPTNLLQYTSPLLSAAYPLASGESRSENYVSRGIYSSSQSFSNRGDVEITADAKGMMILPSGDTLKRVLRIKSVQTIQENSSSKTQAVLENFKWYAQGYRYPVFETVRTKLSNDSVETLQFETAFFYPPQDHYYLDDDAENLALQDSEHAEKPDNPWEGLNYNFYPNPVTTFLNMELYLPRAAHVKLQLHTQSGLFLLNESKGSLSCGLHSLRLDLPVLATGNYILTILLDDYPVSETIMKR